MNTFSKAMMAFGLTATMAMPMVSTAYAAPASEQQATQQLVGLLSGLNSLTANFEQKTTSTGKQSAKQKQSLTAQHMSQSFSGVMKVARPGKFYWETTRPAKQVIVSTGSSVLIYDPDLRQAVRQKLDSQVSNTPALLLSGNTAKIMQTYRVTQPDAGKMSYVLYPKNKDGVFQSLSIGFAANKTPLHMILKDNMGQLTHIRFSNAKLNASIPASTFNFTPP
ncbi:MAG: outer membrane lipoprotein chaperone LolA, partial [Acinetobacter sp.]|nr:outer membrane lipoprotein chaperone LolA [Acinetobacter sp.]